MSKIKVFVVFDIDDRGIWSEVIETDPNFEGIKKAVSSTLVNEDAFDSIEDFGLDKRYSLPSNIIMLQGHDYENIFPKKGVMHAGHESPGFVFDFIDGPIVFVKETAGGYKSLDDGDVCQINRFLDGVRTSYYGDEYLDYSRPDPNDLM